MIDESMLARLAQLLGGGRTDRGDRIDDLDSDRSPDDEDAEVVAEALRLRRGVDIDPYDRDLEERTLPR